MCSRPGRPRPRLRRSRARVVPQTPSGRHRELDGERRPAGWAARPGEGLPHHAAALGPIAVRYERRAPPGHGGSPRGRTSYRAASGPTCGRDERGESRSVTGCGRRRSFASIATRRVSRRAAGSARGELRAANEYPDGTYPALLQAAAAYVGTASAREQVVIGAGADQLIFLCARAFLAPGGGLRSPRRPIRLQGGHTAHRSRPRGRDRGRRPDLAL